MPHAPRLGLQIAFVVRVGRHVQRQALDHRDAQALQGQHFGRVVGQQAHALHAQLLEHAGRHGVVAGIVGQAQQAVGLDRVGPRLLQRVGANLVDQADAPALLAQVQQHAAPGLGDGLQAGLKLSPAVTLQAVERVAGQALAVQTGEYRLAVVQAAQAHRRVLGTGLRVHQAVQVELTPVRGQPATHQGAGRGWRRRRRAGRGGR